MGFVCGLANRSARLSSGPGIVTRVGWYAGTRATEERRQALVYEPSDLGQTTDSFDRDVAPAALGSDTAAEPIPWAVLGSGFEATELGVARVAATPQGENSMALTDPGVSDLTLLATVDSALRARP